MASVYAFGKLQRSSPGQQTSPCSVCVITGSNFLCGVDLTSNTAKTLHDSDQEVVQLEQRCEYINMSSAWGTGGIEDLMLWTSPLSCIAVSNTSTVLSLELPSVVSSLYTSKLARSVTSITVSLLWSDNSCGMVCCSRNTAGQSFLTPQWARGSPFECLLLTKPLDDRPLRNWTQSPNLPDVSSVERYDTPRLHSTLAKFWREYITQRRYWYTTHRLRHIQDILLYETSNMLKRRTVRTWRNIMISNCSPVCTVSLELPAGSFLQFCPTCWTRCTSMKDGTQVQQHCRNSIWLWSRLANLLFHPSSSELLAVSSLAWQVWYSGVSGPGSLFLFDFVPCNHASYKIGTSPPCNWAKHSWWKSSACWRRIFLRHHFVIGVCLVQTITSWRGTFLLLQQVLKQAPSAFLCVYHTVTALIITTGGWLLAIAGFCSPEVQKEPNSTAAVKSDCQLRSSVNSVNSPSSSSALWHKHLPHVTVCEILY